MCPLPVGAVFPMHTIQIPILAMYMRLVHNGYAVEHSMTLYLGHPIPDNRIRNEWQLLSTASECVPTPNVVWSTLYQLVNMVTTWLATGYNSLHVECRCLP